MKKLVVDFLVALAFLAYVLCTGCQSNKEKIEKAKEDVEKAEKELAEARQDSLEKRAKMAETEAWKTYKSEAELKIKENEVRIQELKVKLKKPGKALDDVYRQKIETLEQKNRDLKARLDAYETEQSDWEAFTREFNRDMDELGKALRDLTVDNTK